jgi:hypothetical protein
LLFTRTHYPRLIPRKYLIILDAGFESDQDIVSILATVYGQKTKLGGFVSCGSA